jgi:uncharacterized protein
MGPGERALRPVAISTIDLPETQRLLVHGCEDCACAVSEEPVAAWLPSPSETAGETARWVHGGEIVDSSLDEEHRLLFNPLGHGGVVVLNEAAHDIFRIFRRPTTLGEAHAAWPGSERDLEEVFQRLRRFDLVGTDARPPRHGPPGGPQTGGDVLTAWLHVTNACNLRCPYCYVNKSAEPMEESVGFVAVEAVIRSAVAHGFPAVKLKYAGGEASLNHRLLVRMHAHAKTLAADHGIRLEAVLLSNGVALPAWLIKTLKAEEIRVMISIDGVGAEHDAQRPFADGRPSFRFVEKTIARLLDDDHPPHLSITITDRNAGAVADVVRFALDRDLTFSLNFFRDNDCATGFPDLRYQDATMISGLLEAFAVIEERLPPWSVLGSILDRGQLLRPRRHPCGVGNDYVVIDQRGQVAKCHMTIGETLGDVVEEDPLRLVRHDRTSVRNLPVEEKEGCRDCTWRYWCSGGCPVATFRATGRYDVKSPNCNIYRAIYPHALRLEGLRILKYAI